MTKLQDMKWRWQSWMSEPVSPTPKQDFEEALWAYTDMYRQYFPNATEFAVRVLAWLYTGPYCEVTSWFYFVRYIWTGVHPLSCYEDNDRGFYGHD